MKQFSFATHLGNWSSGTGPLHLRLTVRIVRCIQEGLFPPGSRLPAERALAGDLSISRTTVLNSYAALRSDGWIESRHGSGTWVALRKAAGARAEAHTSVVEHSSLMPLINMGAEEVVDFALAIPEALPGTLEHLSTLSAEMQQAIVEQRYHPPLGITHLRQALASRYRARGLRTELDQLLVTSGAQQAISLIVSLYVQRGDVVLIENPSYFGALDVLKLAGARLIALPMTGSHISPRMLRDRIIATGARLVYLTPTHHNPTGITMPEASRKQIAAIADEFGTPILEDESLADLHISGTCLPPIANFSKSGSVLTIGSLSKLYWSGLRVGWVRGSQTAIQQLVRVKSALDLGCSIPSQAIAAQLLSDWPDAKSVRSHQLKSRRDRLARLLQERIPEWQFSLPRGGLCLWVKLPATDAPKFAQYCLRHQVTSIAGPIFSADGAFHDHLRIPFLLEEKAIEIGVKRLAKAWREFNTLGAGRDG